MSPCLARSKIWIVGVGGQGTLTAARFLGEAALASDLHVMVSQLHGMSQRGGSVECAVLLGPGESAFVGAGEADVVLALEPLEALRARPRMSPDTVVILNRAAIVPSTLSAQGQGYPSVDAIEDQLREVCATLVSVDGAQLAREAGAPRSLNVVMLGALAALDRLPLSAAQIEHAIEAGTSPRTCAINLHAFALGRDAARIARAQ